MEANLTLLVHPAMSEILGSLTRMLVDGARELGIDVTLTNSLPRGFAGRALVLGANCFRMEELAGLTADSVVFNVENTTSVFMTGDYLHILRKFRVWDFDAKNAADLSRIIGKPVFHMKVFFVNRLARIFGTVDQDIDVLFYGTINDRRRTIIDQLAARDLRVEAADGVYGPPLDKLIARAKVVINIHYYINGRVEIIRLMDLLAHGKAIVTEVNAGEALDTDLMGGVAAAPYESLVQTALSLVRDMDRRTRTAQTGERAFRRRRADPILRDALNWNGGPRRGPGG